MEKLQSAFGILAILFFAWCLSENRRRFPLRFILTGLLLQFLIAASFRLAPPIQDFFLFLNRGVMAIDHATKTGSSFMFGYLGGGKLPFQEIESGTSFIIAFQVLPIVLVVSALSALLFYYGVTQKLVRFFAWVLRRSMGVRGAAGLGVSAGIFLGIIETPIFVKPYLRSMSRGDLFILLASSMGSIAGTVLVLYAAVITPVLPLATGELLIASLMSAPAAIIIAKIMVPSVEALEPEPDLDLRAKESSPFEALINGTMEGAQMIIGIVAVIIVLFSLVDLANQGMSHLPLLAGQVVTLQGLLGYLFAPLCWLIGIPASEMLYAGSLMGTKTVLNEFVAYLELGRSGAEHLSERSRLIMTYALCGFANLGSLGILIGGLGAALPERRTELIALSSKALIAGALATLMIGAVTGVLS